MTHPSKIEKPAETPAEKEKLLSLLPKLAAAAQGIYDNWDQDENGLDPELGSGGICDRISQALAETLAAHGWETTEGGQDGDDHSFLFTKKSPKSPTAFGVDIPASTYERGAGYSWTKIPRITFTPDHFAIWEEKPNLCFPTTHK